MATLSLVRRSWILEPLFFRNANGIYNRLETKGPFCWDFEGTGLCLRTLLHLPPFVVLVRLAHPSPPLLCCTCTVSNTSSISLLSILDLGLGLRLGLHSQTHVASGHQVLSTLSDLRPCVLLCSKQGEDGRTGAISVSRNSCYGQTIPRHRPALWQQGHGEGCRAGLVKNG